LDIVHFLGLGVVIFVLLTFGDTMLMMRTSMTDTLYEQYVMTARAKGLAEDAIRDRHASPNALLPVLSRQIVNIPILLSGMVMIEEALSTGGMGTLLFDSLRNYDIPVVMGALLIIGVVALGSRLALEIAIAYLDPRLRSGTTAQRTAAGVAEFRSQGLSRAAVSGLASWLRPASKRADRTATRLHAEASAAAAIPPAGRFQARAVAFRRSLRENWRVFSENRLAVLGLILIGAFAGMACLRPLLMNTFWNKSVYDPMTGFDPLVFPNPSPPRSGHLLGTDALGRDIFSMLLAATSSTLAVALSSALTAAVIGTLIGAVAGYFWGSGLATILGYLSDALLMLPAPIVMVIVGARFYNEITPLIFGVLYGVLAGCSYVAIVMRSQALIIMNKPFIEASWVAGAGHRRIIFSHLIPHLLPLAAVQMMLTVVGAVIAYGFIAFIGDAMPTLNWGSMIYHAIRFSLDMLGKLPWMQLAAPAAALSLFAAAFYMVSRGLHDIAEPRLRK
jgi:peptide/nickel transport system permease protein